MDTPETVPTPEPFDWKSHYATIVITKEELARPRAERLEEYFRKKQAEMERANEKLREKLWELLGPSRPSSPPTLSEKLRDSFGSMLIRLGRRILSPATRRWEE